MNGSMPHNEDKDFLILAICAGAHPLIAAAWRHWPQQMHSRASVVTAINHIGRPWQWKMTLHCYLQTRIYIITMMKKVLSKRLPSQRR